MSKRMSGNSITQEFKPEVSLVASTTYPIGTLFAVWHNSRYSVKVAAEEIQELYDGAVNENLANYLIKSYPEYGNNAIEIIEGVVKLVIKCDVPASEFVSISFCIDNANVAWREQLVRARKLSIWMQTSRTADLRDFDATRLESVRLRGGEEAVKIYDDAVESIREAYRQLAELGVPTEDIRLTPQSMTHRVMFSANLRDLIKLIAKRNSWIAQSTIWSPISAGIIKILREIFGSSIIDDFFGKCEDIEIAYKEDGTPFIAHYKYDNEVMDRYVGKDPQPVDPLWLAYKGLKMPEHTDLVFYDYLKSLYINIWNSDILEILGWDREDPAKLGYFDRPE